MSRNLWLLAALAVLALIVAGCSNAPAGTGSSSGDNTTATAAGSSGGANIATSHEQAVKFAECMRDNGVAEFPDPNASGQFAYGIKGGSSLDPSTAAWKKAIGACKDLEPAGALGEGGRSPDQQKVALKFAQCMRDNGVKDFPDPAPDGPLIDTSRMPGSPAAHSIPGFDAAAHKCLAVYSGELGLGGQ